ncbi:uncharacterized protein LOC114743956 [Neltuma alba]|uniref:uncharacterized protein LOC114725348 n=1 Tax=Neltuma alba TaxID=207710 RepID=UPI0010A41B87|nr:uncharacterized protein LOC114725348 [Prosopis alba]XP_028787975.1 uncharacterized protein LOC114743956 [Prosopis alba]
MAAIESDSKISLHVRSNSFPSAPHPLVSQLEEHLKRLKSSESATSSSLSHKLNGLQDLHECTDKLLQLNITQQVLTRGCSREWVDELLDGSLRLLDICSTAKDCLLQSKECVYEIQSAIRRRRGDESAFTAEGGKYLASRKNMKKAIQKVFGNVKEVRHEFKFSSANKENDMLSFVKRSRYGHFQYIRVFVALYLRTKGTTE